MDAGDMDTVIIVNNEVIVVINVTGTNISAVIVVRLHPSWICRAWWYVVVPSLLSLLSGKYGNETLQFNNKWKKIHFLVHTNATHACMRNFSINNP